jgi:CheY-like chemotaxis protein
MSAHPSHNPPVAGPAARGIVLLVEDEDGVREFVRFVLEQNGYVVVPAADGEAALALFRADPGRFDLVLSDVLMPHRTGPELAAELRRLRPGIPVVFMSGFTGDAPPGAAPVVLLEKPFSPDCLLAAVAAAAVRE